jgi:hypothetical protein
VFPIGSLERIENREADNRLIRWGHYLGACNRPFGRQSFGFFWDGELVGVAVSATTVKSSTYGFPRTQVCEFARCCSHPDHRDLTRVLVRLYRKVAADEWTREYWPASALLSYSNRARHEGDIFRFDGWARYMETRWVKVRTTQPKAEPFPQRSCGYGLLNRQ